MDEYIKRKDVLSKFLEYRIGWGAAKVKGVIESIPTADVVEVVRCKDCKYAEHWYGDKFLCSLWNEQDRVSVFADGFCSYGTVKQEATCTK